MSLRGLRLVVDGHALVDVAHGRPVRSLLFVAGHDELGLARASAAGPGAVVARHDELEPTRASAAGPGAVVADLEDLVPVADKARARQVVASWCGPTESTVVRLVRVGSTPDDLAADLAALAGTSVDGLVVPKASTALLDVAASLGVPLVALVETAAGVRAAYELAAHPAVVALAIGIGDLARDLGLPQPVDPAALAYARSRLVVDSAAAGVAAPYDVPFAGSGEALVGQGELARRLGMGGKICRTVEHVRVADEVWRARDPAGDPAGGPTGARADDPADARTGDPAREPAGDPAGDPAAGNPAGDPAGR